MPDSSVWRAVCHNKVPPSYDYFGWIVATSVLPCTTAIVKRISSFSMSCSICGHIGETDTYTILECPLASQVWQSCDIDSSLWALAFQTLADYLDNARKSLDEDHFGDFLAVTWEFWNARNCFIFKALDHKLSSLGKGLWTLCTAIAISLTVMLPHHHWLINQLEAPYAQGWQKTIRPEYPNLSDPKKIRYGHICYVRI